MKNTRISTSGPWVALLIGVALCALPASRVVACTLWGAVVTNAPQGTVISKNRDWKPDHTQVLKMYRGKKGYAYFGLYAEGGSEPGIKEGVNEKGMTVINASASCIPQSRRNQQTDQRGVTSKLLSGYATCDDVLADKDAIFPHARATFILISDRTKILTVEVGLEGRYAVRTITRGFVAHTNHYLEPELARFNEKIGASSATRLNRVTQLLEALPTPCSTESFAAISRDQHDGPDNSLWRTGSGARTLASWIVETHTSGAPKLRVVLANPGQPEETRTYVLDGAFWSK